MMLLSRRLVLLDKNRLTIPHISLSRLRAELFPVHSPLLWESLLFSFPARNLRIYLRGGKGINSDSLSNGE